MQSSQPPILPTDAGNTTGGTTIADWGPGLRERIQAKPLMLACQHGAATGVAAADVDGLMVYCVGSSGILKILSLQSGTQIRAAKLTDVPLAAVALLPLPSQSAGASHPLVLASGYDNKVYAYSVEYGRQVGFLEAHDDTISCLELVGPTTSASLFTGSWDSNAKLWRLEEGRQPWGSNLAHPERELPHEAPLWALSASPDASMIVTGSEDGSLAAWDLRSPSPVFQLQVTEDYIGGVSLTPDSRHAVVAGGDGEARLLDMRRWDTQLASVSCGSALHCCACDGMTALMGSDAGQVHFWDVAQLKGHSVVGGWAPPAPDGLFPSLPIPGASPMNGICVTWSGNEASRGANPSTPCFHVLGAHQDGQVSALVTSL
eukprot:jgi/Botrbrau1/2510/Bobra.0079s0002.1